eukprot:2926583-Rhodomonas_salina.1
MRRVTTSTRCASLSSLFSSPPFPSPPLLLSSSSSSLACARASFPPLSSEWRCWQVVNAGCAPKDLAYFEEKLGKFGGDVSMEVQWDNRWGGGVRKTIFEEGKGCRGKKSRMKASVMAKAGKQKGDEGEREGETGRPACECVLVAWGTA